MTCTLPVASYPGLLTPAFVACSTNAGEGLVKLSHAVTYLDVWRSGTFLEKQQVSECATDYKHRCRTTEHLTSDSLGNVSWIQKAILQLYRKNVLLLHTSRHVIVTNDGVRRCGYEATPPSCPPLAQTLTLLTQGHPTIQ